jgi:hypothetical protein
MPLNEIVQWGAIVVLAAGVVWLAVCLYEDRVK